MIIKILPYSIILLIFLSGAALYKKSFGTEGGYRFSKEATRRNISRIVKWYQKEFKTEEIFKQAGIRMPAYFYQTVRYSVLALWLIYMTYARLVTGSGVNMHIALWLVFLVATRPSMKLLKYRSPFCLICEAITKKNREKCSIEIDRCLSQLKNMAISMSDKALSSDCIIREISKSAKIIKPYLNRLLAYWYEGRQRDGQEYFAQAIGTEPAKSFAALLGRLDYIPPDKLISQIELYQSQLGEKRKTAVKKAREIQGNIVFMIALVSGFAVLINFLVVVVGIDAFSMLRRVSF
ncbi:hypothetical protein LY28_03637 [Ruminiclostridium sufflavum DSM 19573]|uniref:Flp pilus assembly protein TadB n=1 Tax=Ruminiclostridium sufflavum DSM 19573 TaxID=1121337 RepID=A0A318XFN4_9FIRM|nr:hypothetical protein [Ruminiclostridium sufflavum]PYG84323.1 hypothetical protein LY28_03637 [Ruminiclostridium sufflavum DSM 19573]